MSSSSRVVNVELSNGAPRRCDIYRNGPFIPAARPDRRASSRRRRSGGAQRSRLAAAYRSAGAAGRTWRPGAARYDLCRTARSHRAADGGRPGRRFQQSSGIHSADNRLLVAPASAGTKGSLATAPSELIWNLRPAMRLHTGKAGDFQSSRKRATIQNPGITSEHGVRRAMNVILQGDGRPFGVLEVDSRSEGEFGEHDVAFLQGAANILGMAIERERYQRKLQATLDRHQILLKEVNHRVKNSLQVVSSMLRLQAHAVGDPALSERLVEASTRITAVGRAYNRLAYHADYENIDLVAYLSEVIDDLKAAIAPYVIQFDAPEEIHFAADRAILVADLQRNCLMRKHAYPDGSNERIWVRSLRGKRVIGHRCDMKE